MNVRIKFLISYGMWITRGAEMSVLGYYNDYYYLLMALFSPLLSVGVLQEGPIK